MAGILQILNGSVDIVTAIFCFFVFFKWRKKPNTNYLYKIFALSGFVFFISGFLKLGWGTGTIESSESEIATIFTAFNIARTIIVLFILRRVFSERKIVYIFYTYWILIMASSYSQFNTLKAVDFISFAILLFVFAYAVLFSNYYLKKAGIAGIFYSFTSIAFLLLPNFGYDYQRLFWFATGTMLVLVLYFIYLDVSSVGIIENKKSGSPAEKFIDKLSKILKQPKRFFVTVFLIAFTLLTTIAIHEIGHGLAAKYYNCDITRVVIYESMGAPHTEIKCQNGFNETVITIAGILLTTLGGFVFMLIGLGLTNNMAYMIVGFGLLLSHGDLKSLQFSESLMVMIWLAGMIITALGAINLTAAQIGMSEKNENNMGTRQEVEATTATEKENGKKQI